MYLLHRSYCSYPSCPSYPHSRPERESIINNKAGITMTLSSVTAPQGHVRSYPTHRASLGVTALALRTGRTAGAAVACCFTHAVGPTLCTSSTGHTAATPAAPAALTVDLKEKAQLGKDVISLVLFSVYAATRLTGHPWVLQLWL